jgi:hypothetical protein
VVAFATAAVEALLEQADFGLECVDTRLQLPFTPAASVFNVGLAPGALLLAFGFAEGGALVQGLVEGGLAACVLESLLAVGQSVGWPSRQGVERGIGGGCPTGECARFAGPRGGR